MEFLAWNPDERMTLLTTNLFKTVTINVKVHD